ncbi:hypothetical protein CEN49_03705 [Fischerella thermalis CCMEE 5273]|nr:hypothetical protein CEN49_03705 [Fischerella thermalis CCMEE 5273]
MKIWLLRSNLSEEFEDLQLVDFDRDSKQFDKFNETHSIAKLWNDVEVYTLTKGLQNDFPHFWGRSFVPVLSKSAKNFINDLIEGKAEALPLIHSEHEYYAVHVFNTIDAINYNKAVIKKLPSGLRVGFKMYSFIPEKVIGQHIFKVYLDNRVHSVIFVSDTFKERVTSSSLIGYDFVEVWDSEKEDFDQPLFPSGM